MLCCTPLDYICYWRVDERGLDTVGASCVVARGMVAVARSGGGAVLGLGIQGVRDRTMDIQGGGRGAAVSNARGGDIAERGEALKPAIHYAYEVL